MYTYVLALMQVILLVLWYTVMPTASAWLIFLPLIVMGISWIVTLICVVLLVCLASKL